MSFYDKAAEDSSICSYQCTSFLEKVENNRDCLNEVELDVQRLGGQRNFFGVILFFLASMLAILIGLVYRHTVNAENVKNIETEMYQNWEEGAANSEFANSSETDFSMKDNLIWYHSYRTYLVGENSIKYPWVIPKDFPSDALSVENMKHLLQFIDDYNNNFRFTNFEKFWIAVIRFVLPGFGKYAHFYIRRKKFNNF